MTHCWCHMLVAAADNDIGAQGAKALADALAPRQNPDGTWTYNNTLETLELNSAPSLPAHPSPFHPSFHRLPRFCFAPSSAAFLNCHCSLRQVYMSS